MRGREAGADLPRDVPRLWRRDAARPMQICRERLAVDEFHRQIVDAAFAADVVDAADVRMRHFACQANLAGKTFCVDRQAVRRAQQPPVFRSASICVTSSFEISAPSSASPISTIRPRGESASSAHSTYVGQVCRQNPQWTQSSTMSRSDASNEHPRVAGPRGIEALLHATHQLVRASVPGRAPGIHRCAQLIRGVEQDGHRTLGEVSQERPERRG